MSTSTLLFVSAWLRGIAHADRVWRSAPSVPPFGRSRASISSSLNSPAIARDDQTWSPKDGGVVARAGEADALRVCQRLDATAGAAPVPDRRPLTLFLSRRRDCSEKPRRREAAGPPDPLPVGRASLAFVTLVLLAASTAVAAQDRAVEPDIVLDTVKVEAAAEPVRIGGRHAGPCVMVDIAGHRAGHLDCATQALEEAARIARRDAEAARDISVAQAGSPDVQVGVASRSATRLRLRENFGVSVRPPVHAPVHTNPMGRRP